MKRQRFESFFKTKKDGETIFYQFWEWKREAPWLWITHGQGEHSDCYQRLIEGLSSLPINFFAWDLRGHGRSSGKRGYAPHFLSYIDDFIELYENTKSLFQNQKRFWLGHSLGGLIQLLTLIRLNLKTDPQILSSPFLGLSMPVPLWKDMGSVLLSHVAPKICLWNQIKNEMLTRDPLVLKEYAKDPLRHHKISASVYLGTLSAHREVFARLKSIQNPILIQIAENDPIVSSAKNQQFFELLPSS
ncbi:MAG: lysophospholipase, partial [Bdellovibrionaceae bacterium]|nr:lysophospholipase [Pseudobdellovibrionaceae bacterium]